MDPVRTQQRYMVKGFIGKIVQMCSLSVAKVLVRHK